MKHECIVKIKGGLGNQLFQLAFGLWLVEGDINKVWLDLSAFDRDNAHGGFALEKLFLKKFNTIKNGSFKNDYAVINLDKAPDKYINDLKKIEINSVYEGFFQNYKYVETALPIMRSWYYNSEINEYDVSMQDVLGVHVRRGDYTNPILRDMFGLISEEDVIKLVNKIIHEKPNLRALLFSDDIDLKISGIDLSEKKMRYDKLERDIDEFRKMASCKELICSNSTFSYWAGLISKKNEISYVPSKWMKSSVIKTESLLHSRCKIYKANE